jgi:hypothetical protein
LESNTETIKNYAILKNPDSRNIERSDVGSKEMSHSESHVQPRFVDMSHMVTKLKSGRKADANPGPLSLSAAVPLLGYAAELLGFSAPKKRQISQEHQNNNQRNTQECHLPSSISHDLPEICSN